MSPKQSGVDSSSIAGIRSVTQEPGSNQVSIKYDTVSTQEAQGSLNDQRIQQLLLFAARSNYNSGVRMDSVDLLTQAPDDSQRAGSADVCLAKRYQSGCAPQGAGWAQWLRAAGSAVRDAVLRALISDTNSGVRMQALRLVEPMKTDSNVRSVLTRLAQTRSERLDSLAGAYDAGADAGDGLGTSLVVVAGRSDSPRARLSANRPTTNDYTTT